MQTKRQKNDKNDTKSKKEEEKNTIKQDSHEEKKCVPHATGIHWQGLFCSFEQIKIQISNIFSDHSV